MPFAHRHAVTTGWGACVLAAWLTLSSGAIAQALPSLSQAPAPAPAPAPVDALGRSTPRGTVRGFLAAAGRNDHAVARQYLNTTLAESDGERLARELFAVLDARLPPRLAQVSDAPEGSRANPLAPDEEQIGTITGPFGEVPVKVQRVDHGTGPIWLFSSATLEAVPTLYADVVTQRPAAWIPRVLSDHRVGGVRLFEWIGLLVGIPLVYFATVLLNRLLSPLAASTLARRLGASDRPARNALPIPARLLLIAIGVRWIAAVLPLSLLMRQVLSSAASLVVIATLAWLAILGNGEVEEMLVRRVPRANYAAAVALLRVGRRVVDVVVILLALLATLRRLGVDPTPVVAGLGVGGIALALAAQKTLENVIAGASLIFDQAVRVGDFLRVGTVEGTVDHIGLRSTRIRTLDRSIVSVPNGQIANMSLETLSARDKFWFHPIVALRYETTPDQLHAVIDGLREKLTRHPLVDYQSVRVRFLRLGSSALEVEVFAYLLARDWAHFLELQEQLLFAITEIVAAAGTAIAFPSQTLYVSNQTTTHLTRMPPFVN